MKLNYLLFLLKKLRPFVLVFFLFPSVVLAHGDLSARIKKKTIEISKEPSNAKLYYQRGFLYQQHHEYRNAIKDYNSAETLGFSETIVHFRKAETFYANKQFKEAFDASNISLCDNFKDVKRRKLHAQILTKLEQFSEATSHYKYVIDHATDVRPEDVIEYTKIILNHDKVNYKDAITILDSGLKNLGKDTYSLQLKKLEYLKISEQTEAVIEQYNYFILNNKRNEFWYYRKAKYATSIGKNNVAMVALQFAKTSVQKLSNKFQNTKSVIDLKKNISQLETKLSNK